VEVYIINNRHIKRYVGLYIHAIGGKGYKFCAEFWLPKDKKYNNKTVIFDICDFTTELTA
jgi:hypothetical protein